MANGYLIGRAVSPFSCQSRFPKSVIPSTEDLDRQDQSDKDKFDSIIPTRLKFEETTKKLALIDWLKCKRFEGHVELENGAGKLQIRFVSWNIIIAGNRKLEELVEQQPESDSVTATPAKKCSCDFCAQQAEELKNCNKSSTRGAISETKKKKIVEEHEAFFNLALKYCMNHTDSDESIPEDLCCAALPPGKNKTFNQRDIEKIKGKFHETTNKSFNQIEIE